MCYSITSSSKYIGSTMYFIIKIYFIHLVLLFNILYFHHTFTYFWFMQVTTFTLLRDSFMKQRAMALNPIIHVKTEMYIEEYRNKYYTGVVMNESKINTLCAGWSLPYYKLTVCTLCSSLDHLLQTWLFCWTNVILIFYSNWLFKIFWSLIHLMKNIKRY